jgi:endo-1,4-beta-xylanase
MPRFNEQIFAEFLSELVKRDLKIIISEFDVNDRVAPADTKERDRQVADATKRYLSVALDNPQVIALITWGLMDDDSWITRGQLPAFIRPDSLRPRPLPFDDDFRPKPMYDAMVAAINAAPVR